MNVPLDAIIEKLLSHAKSVFSDFPALGEADLLWLCRQAKSVFRSQPVLLELFPPITICGDLHGQFTDLTRILAPPASPDVANYLFLGDYVDRGPSSLNTIALLFAYKVKYPQNFFMLRGNHECRLPNSRYGFFDECNRYFPNSSVWAKFNSVFDWMPISAVIDGRILCVHGGLSRKLRDLNQLRRIDRPDNGDTELVSDLIWSDPSRHVSSWVPSERGCGWLFGINAVETFLRNNDLDLIVRAHEAVEDGYDFPYYPRRDVVTVFSAPGYCGQSDMKGALLHVDALLNIEFSTVEPEGTGCPII
jgi:serine/threonine-protein phosphatase PP1 catalytic subunit